MYIKGKERGCGHVKADVCESGGVRGDLPDGRKGARSGRTRADKGKEVPKERGRMFTAHDSRVFINCKIVFNRHSIRMSLRLRLKLTLNPHPL
jgi:hypothetical protein